MKSYYFISSFFIILLLITVLLIGKLEKPKHQFDWSNIRNRVKDTVLVIEDYNVVSSKLIGYSSTISSQYDRAKWFLKYSSHNELIQLLNYKNGTVNAYALNGLLKRKNPKIYNHIINSFDKDIYVYTQSSCIGQEYKIFEYYLTQITSTTTNKRIIKLELPEITEKQKDSINILIKKYNNGKENLFRFSYL